MPVSSALIFASSGNILAIILNYFLGFWLYKKTKNKLKSSKIGRKSLVYGHKYGIYTLFLSWLPIIGDPITLVAGLLRINFFIFIFIAASARFLRYYFLSFVI
ncbi:MAG: VTT domain-containing protein [Sulfurimonas sp.]|nr:VTT domain-containing protein [Sulfurimonas sp.]